MKDCTNRHQISIRRSNIDYLLITVEKKKKKKVNVLPQMLEVANSLR